MNRPLRTPERTPDMTADMTVHICFTCRERTLLGGSGTPTDPFVVARHNDTTGEPCPASGTRWIDLVPA